MELWDITNWLIHQVCNGPQACMTQASGKLTFLVHQSISGLMYTNHVCHDDSHLAIPVTGKVPFLNDPIFDYEVNDFSYVACLIQVPSTL